MQVAALLASAQRAEVLDRLRHHVRSKLKTSRQALATSHRGCHPSRTQAPTSITIRPAGVPAMLMSMKTLGFLGGDGTAFFMAISRTELTAQL